MPEQLDPLGPTPLTDFVLELARNPALHADYSADPAGTVREVSMEFGFDQDDIDILIGESETSLRDGILGEYQPGPGIIEFEVQVGVHILIITCIRSGLPLA